MPSFIASTTAKRPVQPLLASVGEAAGATRARPISSTWILDASPRSPAHELPDVHAAYALGLWPDDADAQVVREPVRAIPSSTARTACVDGGRALHPMLLGERHQRLEQDWKEHLRMHVYPEVQSIRSPRLHGEIADIAKRLASLGITPQRAGELYDTRIRPAERRDLVMDKLGSALSYQAAAVIADQVGLPRLSHLPFRLGTAIVAAATATADQFGQGVVAGRMKDKDAAHRRSPGRYAPHLIRLIEHHSTASPDDAVHGVLAPALFIGSKNIVRAAGTVALTAMGAPNGVADAFGVLTDLAGGTAGTAAAGVWGSRLNRRDGFRRFLAFDGAAALLRGAQLEKQQEPRDSTTPTPTVAGRIGSAGRTVLDTARQAARHIPAGIGAVLSWPTVVKAGVLTAANVAGQVAEEKAEQWFGSQENPKQLIDTSVRRRRDVDGSATKPSAENPSTAKPSTAVDSPASPASGTAARGHEELEEVAVTEFLAAGVGTLTAAALGGIETVDRKVNTARERQGVLRTAESSAGLRHRSSWAERAV